MGREIKILPYADDSSVFLDGSYESLTTTVEVFDILALSAGLKVS